MALGRRLGPLGSCDDEPLSSWGGWDFLRGGAYRTGPLGTSVEPPPPRELDYSVLYGDIQRWEGVVKYMYLDTAKPPKVTVGTGNMLPNVEAAQALPFFNMVTNKPATKDEVAAAFNAVAAMQGSMRAPKYKQHPSLEITEECAKDLALKRLKNEFIPKLRRLFRGFDKYPFPARQALIDMGYNMGVGAPEKAVRGKRHKATGLTAFGSLKRDVEAGDWHAASLHCKRANPDNNPHTTERNDWTKKLFETAGQQSAHDQPHRSPAGHQ